MNLNILRLNKKYLWAAGALVLIAFLVYAFVKVDPINKFIYKEKKQNIRTIDSLRNEIKSRDTLILSLYDKEKKFTASINRTLKENEYWMDKYYKERLTPEQILKLKNINYYEVLPVTVDDTLIRQRLRNILSEPAGQHKSR